MGVDGREVRRERSWGSKSGATQTNGRGTFGAKGKLKNSAAFHTPTARRAELFTTTLDSHVPFNVLR